MTALPRPPANLLDGASLFLDFDGTLVDFVVDPAKAAVDDRLRTLLERLSDRLAGRLAILSGRSLDELTSRIGLGPIAIAGSHGLERRAANGEVTSAHIPPGLAIAVDAARLFANEHGLLLETKTAGVALHYRDTPHAEQSVDDFARALATRTGLELQAGKCVRELKIAGANKGDAVRAYLTEPPFALGSPVVMGDDLTDEHAFEAAAALGGCGVLIGEVRPTAAHFRLPTVEATLAFLEAAI
ncbi:MAG: trehalose-phosphatase [Sphingomicrobium sp.]